MEDLSFSDLLAVLRRWKKLFASVSLPILASAVIFAFSWSQYQSTATIQIDQPQVQASVTAPVGASNDNSNDAREKANLRFAGLLEKVTATAPLVEIISKFNLYSGAREATAIAAVAAQMRKKIKVTPIDDSATSGKSGTKNVLAFDLSFSYGNPLLAQQVVNELASRFLDEDLKARRTQAQETSDFLQTQIEGLEKDLSEQETNIAAYQKTHGVTRPEMLAFNQQSATNLAVSLQNIENQLVSVEGTLGTLRGQLANVDPYSRVVADGEVLTSPSIQLKALQSKYATLIAQYGENHPDVVKTRGQIAALQAQTGQTGNAAQLKAQIADARTNLDAARKTYGPEHPDVLALQTKLKSLETQALTKPNAPTGGFVADADNPTYLQLVAQIRAAEDQRRSLMDQHKKIMDMQESYQQAIAANPEAEKHMAELSRDYENAQMRYRELKAKKMTADMDLKLQEERKGERLILLNPPELPMTTSPSRSILLLAALVFAFGGGVAAVIIAQMLSRSIIGAHAVERTVGVAPLVSIPHIATAEEKAQSSRRSLDRLRAYIQSRIAPRAGENA